MFKSEIQVPDKKQRISDQRLLRIRVILTPALKMEQRVKTKKTLFRLKLAVSGSQQICLKEFFPKIL